MDGFFRPGQVSTALQGNQNGSSRLIEILAVDPQLPQDLRE
jgi:hypothetical protein